MSQMLLKQTRNQRNHHSIKGNCRRTCNRVSSVGGERRREERLILCGHQGPRRVSRFRCQACPRPSNDWPTAAVRNTSASPVLFHPVWPQSSRFFFETRSAYRRRSRPVRNPSEEQRAGVYEIASLVQGAPFLLRFEALHLVAYLKVVPVFKAHAALTAFAHLGDIFLHILQRIESACSG